MGANATQIEDLIHKIENLQDPVARENTIALVQALMEFHGEALSRLMDFVADAGAPGYAIFDQFATDEAVSSLLLLYGLHPLALDVRVKNALEKVRPLLDSHGGNVELVEIQDGVVRLRLQGSCKGCPSSSLTLVQTIEEAIYAAAPDVNSIEAVNDTEPEPETAFVQIGKVPRHLTQAEIRECVSSVAK